MKIKFLKKFDYSLKGYDIHTANPGDELDLPDDIVKMAWIVGVAEQVVVEEPKTAQQPVKWLPNGKPASTKGKK